MAIECKCPKCGKVENVATEEEAVEWAINHDAECGGA